VNILETRGLTKQFGGLTAVDRVTFQVPKGELRAIIGSNGAGKTTFFNMLAGKLPPTSGEIWFKGEDATHVPRHLLTRKGIGRSYQITNIFPKLTVFENVRLAVQGTKVTYAFWRDVRDLAAINDRVQALLDRLRLTAEQDTVASNLPHGLQRHLEIGMALASDPELLLLDEPAAGMTREETQRMIELIRNISASGITIVLVEHDMTMVMAISQRITVLHEGRVLAEGSPDEIRRNDVVQRVYLGRQK
jgi:branched-chain amino acid transport system ATP-binding protein